MQGQVTVQTCCDASDNIQTVGSLTFMPDICKANAQNKNVVEKPLNICYL